ncbi:hypothetical protein NQ314_001656 [Rhamnusium bicolor]|uniref:tRNA/rRNA methyltransferase SpoU type domain-containing protein n=1 Tax=Rhamnusium bicolor TaxID=1586634 RepID=A0AAV8ZTR0_9CUCU|nr:hypothetical protein NQ314_001656 [Rhamnusium bicolor]
MFLAAIKKLLKEAQQKSYKNFLRKYDFLEKSVNSVIEASGQAYYETLKSDRLFFDKFSPDRDYSLQSIYVDIPKLNGVTKTEWENFTHYEFTTRSIIEISNKDKTFANSVIDVNSEKSGERTYTNMADNTYNIQRKITPWKLAMEEQGNEKQLGDFILIASLIDKSTNLGGLSRTCEVFGIKQLILNDAKIVNDKDFKSLSMTSENWIDAVEVKIADLKTFILEIREKGYCIIGAEQTSESINLNEYNFKKNTALLLG